MESNTNIIIVDDHALFREGMKLLIEKEGMGKVIAEADNGKTFLTMLKKQKPDLVIMDIEMPLMGGLEATAKAIDIFPDLKVLVLTMLNEKENYSEMINAGVMGFVLKTAGKKELETAIQTVLRGESYFSSTLLHQIIIEASKQKVILDHPIIHEHDISKRELEVLQLMSDGLSTTEIAEKLFRSKKTIEMHRTRLQEKTNTKNIIQLVIYGLKNNLAHLR